MGRRKRRKEREEVRRPNPRPIPPRSPHSHPVPSRPFHPEDENLLSVLLLNEFSMTFRCELVLTLQAKVSAVIYQMNGCLGKREHIFPMSNKATGSTNRKKRAKSFLENKVRPLFLSDYR